MNAIRDRLRAGKTVVGTAGSLSEENMSMLADSGLDFILFDTQHSPIELKEYKDATDELCKWIDEGKIKYRETITEGLENAPQGLRDVLSGKNFGKQVIKVAEE